MLVMENLDDALALMGSGPLTRGALGRLGEWIVQNINRKHERVDC